MYTEELYMYMYSFPKKNNGYGLGGTIKLGVESCHNEAGVPGENLKDIGTLLCHRNTCSNSTSERTLTPTMTKSHQYNVHMYMYYLTAARRL